MKLRYHQIDAFSDRLFGGNPAGVCPLEAWLPAEIMQKIAMENNQAETAFYVPGPGRHAIRWFTPAVEVDLCGHATLAAAYVIFHVDGFAGPRIEFDSRSGLLTVRRDGERLTLDFPADEIVPVEPPELLVEGLGAPPAEAYKGKTDYMLVYDTAEAVADMRPDFGLVAKVPARGVIVTSPGRDTDFVSRFFGPQVGIDEDPVTGSAHTTLTPYWAKRLRKAELTAAQLSKRGGRLWCKLVGDRVEISGQARAYLRGEIEIL
ncbi:MAG: PhzF family phenazine biosynthesis protein [Candidatus Aminicenantes bacterium]|nr:PhzF family phenazine biosynthesis protein [Candidatus Aminicenantes bacterium]